MMGTFKKHKDKGYVINVHRHIGIGRVSIQVSMISITVWGIERWQCKKDMPPQVGIKYFRALLIKCQFKFKIPRRKKKSTDCKLLAV